MNSRGSPAARLRSRISPARAVRRAFAAALLLSFTVGSAGPLWAAAARENVDRAIAASKKVPPERQEAREWLEQAIASGDDRLAVAEAHFRLAALDEEQGAFAHALDHDRACVDQAPGSRWARSAGGRISWLSARADGGFVPLQRLMQVWRDPAFGNNPAAVEAFAREADSFPPGVVRGESRMFVADAWLRLLKRPQEATRELTKVRDDPSVSPQSALFAERELAAALLGQGNLDAAAREVHTRGPAFEPAFVTRVERLVKRRTLRRVATGALLLFVLLSGGLSLAGRKLDEGALRRDAGGALGAAARSKPARVLFWGVSGVAALFVVLDRLRPSLLDRLGL